MRHVTLACKKHPQLRWSCKAIAFSPGKGYNGQRNIFFQGERQANGVVVGAVQEGFENYRIVQECACKPSELVLAPEDPWSELSEAEQQLAIWEDCEDTAPVTIVKRSELKPELRFSVEVQAPAGNWVRTLGTNDWEGALSFAMYEWQTTRRKARVVKEEE